MDKLYNYLLLLSFIIIILIIIYLIYDNNKELFIIGNMDIKQKYNIINHLRESYMNRPNNEFTINLRNKETNFIKGIYIWSDINNKIPINLEIKIEDTENNITNYVDMKKYITSENIELLNYKGQGFYFDNIKNLSGDLIKGNKITFKSNIDFRFNRVYVYGNVTGNDYKEIMYNIIDNSNYNINNNIITFNENNNYTIERIKFKEFKNQNKLEYWFTIGYKNKGMTSLIKYDNGVFNKSEFLVNIRNPYIYFDKIFIANKIKINNINLTIDKIYGKKTTTEDEIQNKIELKNSSNANEALNPKSIFNLYEDLETKISKHDNNMNVLNYQEKINKELKQLENNKMNLQLIQNQRNKVNNLIDKIELLTNKYADNIKNNDSYNLNKFKESVNILNHLKKELDNIN